MMRPGDRRALLTVGIVTVVLTIGALSYAAVDRSHGPELPPGFGPGPVAHGVARTVDWAEAVEDLAPGVDGDSSNPCQAGHVSCLAAVVAEMEARVQELGCDHRAPFAFTYLEMTRGVHARVSTAGFFESPDGVSNLDALFAQLYFDAVDNWSEGRRNHVPGAWRIALQVADEQRASAAADLLLGMNAHISRDLAYVVAMLAQVDQGFARDSTDFLRINDVIDEVRDPMLQASAQRYDPAIADLDGSLAPEITANLDSGSLITQWRSEAFRLGLALAQAGDAIEREVASAEIERNAVAIAALILNADGAVDFGLPADQRHSHCTSNLD